MHPLDERLSERAALAGVAIDTSIRPSLLTYYDLLVRWNQKINLTALDDPDEAIDRLLLEPVTAARPLPPRTTVADLGSGGGSPAIPLALALGATTLLMIESKSRKAAFLREAARAVHLPAIVQAQRFEDVAASGRYAGQFSVVTLRAVRMDAISLKAAAALLTTDGRIALFVSTGTHPPLPPGFRLERTVSLFGNSELLIVNVPRETMNS